MRISIIAAHGTNREIGRGNTLLWHLPPDLAQFERLTRDHPLIMGRKTFHSIVDKRNGELLSGNRPHIVLTGNRIFTYAGIRKAASLDQAIELAGLFDDDEVFVIGGGQVYEQALPFADRLCLTLIHDKKKDADVFFPPYEDTFRQTKKSGLQSFKGLYYEFAEYERV